MPTNDEIISTIRSALGKQEQGMAILLGLIEELETPPPPPPPPIGFMTLSPPLASMTITQGFGINADVYDFYSYADGHEGLDLRATEGTDVFAAHFGEVVEAGWSDSYGYHIRIRTSAMTPNGVVRQWTTTYAHLSEMLVPVGQIVFAGALIGKSGNTGRSTGAHLHFDLRFEGASIERDPRWTWLKHDYVNPLIYLNGWTTVPIERRLATGNKNVRDEPTYPGSYVRGYVLKGQEFDVFEKGGTNYGALDISRSGWTYLGNYTKVIA